MTKPTTVSQPHVITKKDVNCNSNDLSSTGVDNTANTRRSHPRSNTKNDRVPSTSKSSCIKNKGTEVEEHPRNLLLSKNQTHMSSECNNIKFAIRNDKSKVVCVMCNQCLITDNHDFMGTVRFGNDYVAAILDIEVAFRRNTYFVRNLKRVDLLKGNRTANLYTINLHEMASASPICLMARATSTKSLLWHQRLSHLNFNTINELAKNDLISGPPKFKYLKEHLCPSCEQGKGKMAPYKPKLVPNSKQRLHLLHMELCGPMRVESIYGKRVGISHQTSSVKTPQQNGVVEQINRTLVEAARTMLIFSCALLFLCAEAIATAYYTQNCSLINGRKPSISFLHVFGALCYPKNDCEDIRKLGEKGDIGFFIGYSANSCAYRVYNRRTKKIIETMNVTFDEISKMAFEQRSPKPELQGMTSGQISLGLNLTYASSTITSQKLTEHVWISCLKQLFAENMFVNPFAPPSISPAKSASQYVDLSNMHTFYQSYQHDYQWTKDNPLEQVIGEPS
ncbi:retrovirus-related pol polyprotein from transposon TNT 1-94 [Tanacetum coccineum]